MNSSAPNGRKANKFKADPLHSTYRWEIDLTIGHPMNKVAFMDGYSAGQGHELTNKVQLLNNKLSYPLLPYLERSDRILIYKNQPGVPKDKHKLILELYPRTFTPHDWVANDMVIIDFLELVYESLRKTGKMGVIEDRRKNRRQPEYMTELDHSKYNFGSLQELKQFCRDRVEKYSYQAMKGWYESHANFQPELFVENNTENLTHAIHQAKTQEQAQAATEALQDQVAMDQLRAKFNTGRY